MKQYKVDDLGGDNTSYARYNVYECGKGVIASFYTKEQAMKVCDELNAMELLKSKRKKLF